MNNNRLVANDDERTNQPTKKNADGSVPSLAGKKIQHEPARTYCTVYSEYILP